MKIFLDFETRSECDLKKCGAVVYAQHPTTRILCMSYAGERDYIKRITPKGGSAFSLEAKANIGAALKTYDEKTTYVAHNISFERAILKYVLGIDTPLERWEDTAAIARFQSLPGALQNLGEYFDQPKDMDGNRVMLKLSKPRRPSKTNPDKYWEKSAVSEDFERLYAYCDRDVELLRRFYKALRPMTEYERKTWILTEQIAERGMRIDVEMLSAAQVVIAQESHRIEQKVKRATGGITATQIAKIQDWLGLPNMQKATVEDALKIETRPRQKYALMARQVLGLASVKKLKAMQQRLAMGGLIHHSLIYAGADRTGRWSGSGIQPQNFPRGYGGDKLDKVFYALANLQPVENTHVSISQSLKGFIVGRDGRSLLVGDYSQIECRVLAWLAGQDDLLQVFADGGDPYCVMAEKVYHYPVNKKEHPEERQLGKALILGCGYGMGGAKFAVTAGAMYGLEVDPDRADELVSIYRDSYPAIKQFWGEVERAFRGCVGGHRISRQVGALTFRGHKGKHVSVELPSTRRLYYNNAHIEYGGDRDKYGNGAIAYYGKCPYTNKMVPNVKSYGAKICENITQAVARDVMAEAMQKVDPIYPVILTVHDEVVSELTDGKPEQGLKKFINMLEQRPAWAQDLPLAVETAVHRRYQK